MLVDASAGPIFTNADAARRIGGVNVIGPRGDTVQRAGIPAIVFVERNDLGIKRGGIVVARVCGGGGEAV